MSEELKLRCCPFCGGDAGIHASTGSHSHEPDSETFVWYYARCDACGEVTGQFNFTCDTPEKAAAIWNTRPIEDALRAENVTLQSTINEGIEVCHNVTAENEVLKAKLEAADELIKLVNEFNRGDLNWRDEGVLNDGRAKYNALCRS